jgi:excisionase family DNA binding protein
MTEPLLLSIEDAARLVGMGRDRAYELVNTGAWPSVKAGKHGRKRRVPRTFLLAKYADAFATPDAPADSDNTPTDRGQCERCGITVPLNTGREVSGIVSGVRVTVLVCDDCAGEQDSAA